MSRAEKYEDLFGPISAEIERIGDWGAALSIALEWLDEHREQTPRPAITESELNDAASFMDGPRTGRDTREQLRAAVSPYVAVLPETVPTNEEKLDADMDDWYAKNKDVRPTLTDHLIERGWVKAPDSSDWKVEKK